MIGIDKCLMRKKGGKYGWFFPGSYNVSFVDLDGSVLWSNELPCTGLP